MKRRFYVKIELELHAITCPGVWLCPNGYLEVTIKSLGYFFKTGALEPKFPVLCHDQFVMEGYFKSIRSYSELERTLGNENIEISLWQSGRRLGYFSGKLGQIMQPPVPRITCYHNVNVQVLMIPSSSFPGIIAPKLELSARAIIQDQESLSKVSSKMFHNSDATAFVPCFPRPLYVSPHHSHDNIPEFRRQKPVCHNSKHFKWHNSRESFVPDRFSDFTSRIPSTTHVCGRCTDKSGRSPFLDERERGGSRSSCHERRSCSSSRSSFGSHHSGLENKRYECEQNAFFHDNCNTDLHSEIHPKNCKICQNYSDAFRDFSWQ